MIDRCDFSLYNKHYGGENYERKETKKHLADSYITYCELNPERYYFATTKTGNVPLNMRDDPHFHQGIYNVVGYDAGLRVGARVYRKRASEYSEFFVGEDVTLAQQFGIDLKYKSI